VRIVAAVLCCWVLMGAAACAEDGSAPSSASRSHEGRRNGSAVTPVQRSPSASVDAPATCLPSAEAGRGTIEGTPEWVRFCPGANGRTVPAEVPSDALTTHLDSLSDLTESAAGAVQKVVCRAAISRTYRVQVGFADGEVAQISGATDPGCVGAMAGSGAGVRGPEGLGVYGLMMSAFGRQAADSFDPANSGAPLLCPVDPRDPDSVDLDGASASLDTGWHLGARAAMVMPLTAVRGIVCTWPYHESEPAIRNLSADEAEQVRIGLHAIFGAMVDCAGSQQPTYTAVVEDKTGTRRAVSIIDSECSTVVRSDGGFGLGFPWLDR
jgi:hypothetical protein